MVRTERSDKGSSVTWIIIQNRRRKERVDGDIERESVTMDQLIRDN